MSHWPAPRWPARVFLRTIGPHPGPRIISTWWKSSSGPAAQWRPAAPWSRSGTRGGDQGAAQRPRAGARLQQTPGSRWGCTAVERDGQQLDRGEPSAGCATALAHHPAWMATLGEVISACVEAHSPMGRRGARDLAPGAPCALLVSATSVALVSGADEGAAVLPGCSLDLHGLLAHGEQVEACQGSPPGGGVYDPDGARAAIEGFSQGHDVWWRVAAAACGCRAGPATLCGRTPLRATPPNERHQGAGASRLASARASGMGALWAA